MKKKITNQWDIPNQKSGDCLLYLFLMLDQNSRFNQLQDIRQ